MRLGKDLVGKPIISVTDGRLLGTVKDLYINDDLYWLAGLFLKSEGLLKRKSILIPRDSVVVFGLDAILVKDSDVVTDDKEYEEAEQWLRLEKLRGRPVDTPGGTKVGVVGDVMLGEDGRVDGFALGKVFVAGPVAEEGTIPRETLVDTGSEDGAMTIDLPRVEKLYQGIEEESEEDEKEGEE